jgi:predicted TIM-barrel fold metal-dependent hydrolase
LSAGAKVVTSGSYAGYRLDWLAQHVEEIIEPERPIVDAHHHLWDAPRPRYLFDDILQDLYSGHNIISTVYVDCRSMYRAHGPVEMRCLGEVEYTNGVAAMSATGCYGPAQVCDGIVGFGALQLGARARPVLEALLRAAGSRFKGVRQVSAYDPDPKVCQPNPERPPGLLADKTFREGFALLREYGLSFDAFLYQTQLRELTDLARAFPDTPILLDHTGTPLGIGPYAGRQAELYQQWKTDMTELASCPNVSVKLGGLGMVLGGFGFDNGERPPSSLDLVAAWEPYIGVAIDLFGTRRAMFESNFPPDKASCSYPVLWNAYKRMTSGASEEEKTDLFSRSAQRFYRLEAPAPCVQP